MPTRPSPTAFPAATVRALELGSRAYWRIAAGATLVFWASVAGLVFA